MAIIQAFACSFSPSYRAEFILITPLLAFCSHGRFHYLHVNINLEMERHSVPIKVPSSLSTGWLEPLVGRIAENQTNVLVPIIDTIDDETLKYGYQSGTSPYVGGFDWGLLFNWHAVPDSEMKRNRYKKALPVRYKI